MLKLGGPGDGLPIESLNGRWRMSQSGRVTYWKVICVTIFMLKYDLFNYFHVGNVHSQKT